MKNGYCTRTIPKLIQMLQQRSYTSAEIMSIFNLSMRQKKVVIHEIKKRAEVESIPCEDNRNMCRYRIISLSKEVKEIEPLSLIGFPLEVSREQLIDLYLQQDKPKPVKNIKDLYELAKQNNIRVYTQTENRRKYIV